MTHEVRRITDRLDLVRKHLRGRRSLAIDVGAHIGDYTSHMVQYFDAVHSFEPVPKNFSLLVANTAVFPQVVPYNMAVGERDGWVNMTTTGKSISCRIDEQGGDTLISMSTLDWLGPWGACDFLKIDVEGYELQVISGAEQLIRQHRPVIMIEEKFDPQYNASRYLESIGYRQVERIKHDRIFKYRR